MPTGTEWWVWVYGGPTFEDVVLRQHIPWQGAVLQNYLVDPRQYTDTNFTAIKEGDPIKMRVQLVESGGVIIDDEVTDRIWTGTQGLGIQQQLGTQTDVATGGYTEQDRQVAEQTQTAAQATEDATQRAVQTVTGAILTLPIGGLLAHPDIHLLNYWPESFTLRGRGVLNGHPAVRFTAYYGIQWAVAVRPPGAGLFDGFVQEYSSRLVQLVALHYTRDATQLYVHEVQDSPLDTGSWYWTEYAPHQVGYDVTPGFELSCRWLAAT